MSGTNQQLPHCARCGMETLSEVRREIATRTPAHLLELVDTHRRWDPLEPLPEALQRAIAAAWARPPHATSPTTASSQNPIELPAETRLCVVGVNPSGTRSVVITCKLHNDAERRARSFCRLSVHIGGDAIVELIDETAAHG